MLDSAHGQFLLAILVDLIFLGALWTGVSELNRSGRTAASRSMVIGLFSCSGGSLLFFPIIWSDFFGGGKFPFSDTRFLLAGSALAIVGGIIFFIAGFVAHTLRMARVRLRIAELEQLAGSMTAELNHRHAANAPQTRLAGIPDPRPNKAEP